MKKRGQQLYGELGDLARFVESAMKAISGVGPQLIASSQQLPTASSHLSDLNKMTEEGALEVMRLTELIQDEHRHIGKELSAVVEVLQGMDCPKLVERLEHINILVTQEGTYLTEIMTALSFQDLVAQRVKKLVSILDEVQHKLMELVVVFGLQQSGEKVMMEGAASDLLKQLEESKTTAMKQKVADDILAQFGFK